jgi:Na+/melibiose symporter-like transporter
MSESSSVTRLPRRLLLGYSIGSLGTGVYSTVPALLLLYFMTDILGVPSAWAMVALLVPKLWGAIIDPVVGMLSDRTRSRLGRRRPWLLVGGLGMSLTFVFLFRVPDFSDVFSRFLYVAAVFAASATAYSIFAVPYVAMPAEMSPDSSERTRVMTYRMSLVMTGVVLGSAISPMLVTHFGGGREGYAHMSVVVGTACALAMLCTFFATHAAAAGKPPEASHLPLRTQLRSIANNRSFTRLISVFVLQTIALGTFGALLPYAIARHLGQDESMVGVLFLLLIGSSILSMPLWYRMSRRWGKRRCLMSASAAHGLLMLPLMFVSPEYPHALLYMQFAAGGIAYAALQLMPFALVTDIIERDCRETGVRREGLYSGVWTACEKIGLALGPATAAALLASSGYVASSEATTVQSAATLDAIRYGLAIIPAVIQIASLALLSSYPEDHASGPVGSVESPTARTSSIA